MRLDPAALNISGRRAGNSPAYVHNISHVARVIGPRARAVQTVAQSFAPGNNPVNARLTKRDTEGRASR